MLKKAHTISIRDIGPHTSLELQVSPGVNVISGHNESGKSIAVRCVAALAGGDAKSLPIRDGSAAGLVSGFGTTLSIGARNTRAGEFSDADSLEDRINIAALVDPGLKDPAAATKHRTRALLTLTGTKLTFEDFRTILPESQRSEITDDFSAEDPVDLAGKIKRQMEKDARHWKDEAGKQELRAKTLLAATDGVDIEGDHDEDSLRASYTSAVQAKSTLDAKAKRIQQETSTYELAKAELAKAGDLPDMDVLHRGLDEREAEHSQAEKDEQHADDKVLRIEQELADANRERAIATANTANAARSVRDLLGVIASAEKSHESFASIKKVVDRGAPDGAPEAEEVTEASNAVLAAEVALTAGAEIRKAIQSREAAQGHLDEAAEHNRKAIVYRDAAKGTDTVLSEAVSSPVFRFEGGHLQAEDHTGTWRPYADISEGGRWKLALLAVSSAIEGDSLHLVTIDQTAWDGLDSENRALIARESEEHNIAIVTAECSDEALAVSHFEPEVAVA